ncbi:RepB family protein [Escherichia coli]
MSQAENTVTPTTGTKRAYRKGHPAQERQRASLARRSNTHKAFHAYTGQVKRRLVKTSRCRKKYYSGADAEKLIESELKRRASS